MRYRHVGNSGLVVSVVGLGCNNFGLSVDADAAKAIVDAAIDSGVSFFDTAPSYGSAPGESERLLGEAIAGRRDAVVLATKVGGFSSEQPGSARGSRRAILHSFDESLRRLGTDFVDVLYLHQPDPATPIAETLSAIDSLITSGKVRYAASSNMSAWQLVEAELVAELAASTRFVAAQNAYSLVDRHVELDIADVCERYGIGLIPYFPLAHGLLAGTYRPGEPLRDGSRLARRPQVVEDAAALVATDELATFAAKRDLTLPDVAIGGLLAKPAVAAVIAGVSRPEQVRANAAAAEWVPTDAEREELAAIASPARYVPLGSRTGSRR